MQYPGVTVAYDQPARMRDGCFLRADVYRPESAESLPVLLVRQPYGKRLSTTVTYAHAAWYASHGYLVAIQDVRGRGASEGEFRPFEREAEDGFDSVEWCAGLPGANGRVGMYGFSYQGLTQLLAAAERPPHLRAICPAMTGSFYDWMHPGGALALAFAQTWAALEQHETALRHGDLDLAAQLAAALGAPGAMYGQVPLASALPLDKPSETALFPEWLAHPLHDDFWRSGDLMDRLSRIDVPALVIAGWFDCFAGETLGLFQALAARNAGSQHLVAGPWQHMPWSRGCAGIDFGPAASPSVVDDVQVAWFGRWLKDEPAGDDLPAARIFVTGRNQWQGLDGWPPPAAEDRRLFLGSAGRANSLDGDGRLVAAAPAISPPDVYVNDPLTPVPVVSGSGVFFPYELGPYDRRPAQVRNDVLVYTSEPLDQSLTLVGAPALDLWVSSSGDDADFIAYLSEVTPDGAAHALTFGVVRASLRNSCMERSWLTPDEPFRLGVPLRPLAHECQAGSRLRVDLASSAFPMIARNSGTRTPEDRATWADMRRMTQLVFHDADRPSSLCLPVQV
jgi:uncharacterized protein